ncbi:hypothetical protein GF325_18815 [Candidatus Bathyarchaeota archaeon]|nr:hypothetical protein [Candidatus Bathyarchaeota archaeon]
MVDSCSCQHPLLHPRLSPSVLFRDSFSFDVAKIQQEHLNKVLVGAPAEIDAILPAGIVPDFDGANVPLDASVNGSA